MDMVWHWGIKWHAKQYATMWMRGGGTKRNTPTTSGIQQMRVLSFFNSPLHP